MVNPYTVLTTFTLPHCSEREHEHFGPDPADARDPRDIPVSEHVSLGMRHCISQEGVYQPGQTVHLVDEQANELIASGQVAAAGATIAATFSVTGSSQVAEKATKRG